MSYQTKSSSRGSKKVGLKPAATPRRSARVSADKGPAVVSDSAGKGYAPKYVSDSAGKGQAPEKRGSLTATMAADPTLSVKHEPQVARLASHLTGNVPALSPSGRSAKLPKKEGMNPGNDQTDSTQRGGRHQ